MTQRTNAEVGERVRARRVELKLTPTDVTDAADIDPKTLQRLESGDQWPIERSRRRIEPVLLWKPGGLDALKKGDEPEELRPEPDSGFGQSVPDVEDAADPGPTIRRAAGTLLETAQYLSTAGFISAETAKTVSVAAEDFKRADELLGGLLSNGDAYNKYLQEFERFGIVVRDALWTTASEIKVRGQGHSDDVTQADFGLAARKVTDEDKPK